MTTNTNTTEKTLKPQGTLAEEIVDALIRSYETMATMNERAAAIGVITGVLARHSAEPALTERQKLRGIYAEVAAERERAHSKHGAASMEAQPAADLMRLPILMEEVGEVAKEFNDARCEDGAVDLYKLRKELIQTAAMATAWADAILAAVTEEPAGN